MKSVYLYIVGFLVVVGVVGAPLVIKQQVSKEIEVERQVLLKHGLELTITKEEGHFSSVRDFELKIVNGNDFRDFLFIKLNEINPSYKNLTDLLKKQSKRGVRPVLDGTLFKGQVKNSNLLPNDTNIEFYLAKLSDVLMEDLNKDKVAADNLNPMLENKTITFYVTLDSNKQVKEISMKDIDTTMKDKYTDIDFKVKGQKLVLNNSDKVVGKYTLAEQLIKTKKRNKTFLFKTTGIDYTFDYLSQFENSGKFHIDNILIEEQKTSLNSSMKISNFDMQSTIKNENNELNADAGYSIQSIDFTEGEKFRLDDMKFKLDIKGVDKEGVLASSDAYNNLALKRRASQDDIKDLTDGLKKILNKGFKSNIDASLKSVSYGTINLGNIDVSISSQLDANTYNVNDSQVIKSFHATGKIVMNEKDLQSLSEINRQVSTFDELAKKDAGKAVFNLEFKEGKLLVNGTQL